MNLSTTSFLVLTVMAFTFSWGPRQQPDSTPDQSDQTAVTIPRKDGPGSVTPTQSFWRSLDPERAKIRVQILDGWPTSERHFYMSRGGPRLSRYADLVLLDAGKDLDSYCLGNFHLVIDGKHQVLAFSYDCKSQKARIFEGHQWHDYETWKTANLKKMNPQQKGA